ncbi:MAG: tetraacyldisaccharide 4'-kinase [Rhodospirillaceae bacterium]
MKAPDFWHQPAGIIANLLYPLGWAYDLPGRWRQLQSEPELVGVPVICVGNLVAGGAGKTPLALSIADMLAGWGLAPHFITRGYGGRLTGPVRVAPDIHGASDVGDEPLLLAAQAPTWVARDRLAGAHAAITNGAKALVLDDGFQNFALSYQMSVLVVDGTSGFGNNRLIPAGPLREPVWRGMARASAVVIMGEDTCGIASMITDFAAATGTNPSIFHASLCPDPAISKTLRGERVLGFAGIGRPAKFFATLSHIGVQLVETMSFPDHYRYSTNEINKLLERAHNLRAQPVTTAKDFVRLPEAVRSQVRVLPVTVAWQGGPDFASQLAKAISHDRMVNHV